MPSFNAPGFERRAGGEPAPPRFPATADTRRSREACLAPVFFLEPFPRDFDVRDGDNLMQPMLWASCPKGSCTGHGKAMLASLTLTVARSGIGSSRVLEPFGCWSHSIHPVSCCCFRVPCAGMSNNTAEEGFWRPSSLPFISTHQFT